MMGLSELQYIFLIIVVLTLTMLMYSAVHSHLQTEHGYSGNIIAGQEANSKFGVLRPNSPRIFKRPVEDGNGGDAPNEDPQTDAHENEPRRDKDVAILPGIRKADSTDTTISKNSVGFPGTSADLPSSNVKSGSGNPSSSSVPSKPKIHAVTYASHGGRDDRFCRAVESAVRNKFDLIILGWGVPWRGLSQKLEAAHAYAQSVPPNDIILFTDAFDVLFTGSEQEIVETFQAANASVIFSAECGCWPHIMENRGRACFDLYPPSPTPYRYLNSGTWIGYAAKAAEMLAIVIKEAGANFANANDQKLMADLFISKRVDIQLDYHNHIFQAMHMTLDPPLKHCDPTKDLQYDSVSKRWVNRLTHGKPAVIHFNGGGKSVHLQMEAKSWYKSPDHNSPQQKQQIRSTRLKAPLMGTDPSRTLEFSELCKDYLK